MGGDVDLAMEEDVTFLVEDIDDCCVDVATATSLFLPCSQTGRNALGLVFPKRKSLGESFSGDGLLTRLCVCVCVCVREWYSPV